MPRSALPSSPSSAPSLRSRLHPGFLATFTLVGLGSIVGLALVLSQLIGGELRQDQLDRAQDSAELLAQSAIAPPLLPQLDRGQVPFGFLDQVLLAAKPTAGFDTVVVLSPRGRVVYANDHRLIGRQTGLSPVAKASLKGSTVRRVQEGPKGASDLSKGEQVAVAVPLRAKGSERVVAVVEVHVPYGPVRAVVTRRTRDITLVLFGVGLLLFAALWPRLLAASRALKRQSDPAQLALVRELRKGLERDELAVHFQPKISLRGGQVTGMEALVRWNHPKRGLLGPDQFVPAAMAGELTGPLTVHVADLSLRACRAWRERGIDAGVNINLGAANVLDEQLPSELGLLLGRWNLPPGALGVEITEAAIAADPERAGAVLAALDDMGLRISIDDFGTGYSSLAGLRTLPVDELKVDRSFVSGLTTDTSDAAIVRSVIGLAHELGIEVVAEGVEDEPTVLHLAGLGCDQAQGYFFARPMDLAALLTWLSERQVGAVAASASVQAD
jgi:EAL domain-containing protein (putative c-di-GMP-specific phosphodiesterase class I)